MMSRPRLVYSTLVALCALLFIAQVQWRPAPLAVCLEILTDEPLRLVVLYQSAGSARENQISRNVSGAPGFQTVRFPIDQAQLGGFRLQAFGRANRFTIRNVMVERFGGKSAKVALGRLKARAGIATLKDEAVEIEPAADVGSSELAVVLRKPVQQTSIVHRFDIILALVLGLASCAVLWAGVRVPTSASPTFVRLATRGRIVALLVALYLGASLAGLNGSSSGVWRFMADRGNPDADSIAGSPKFIRSDEWLVHTPWILSQCNQQPPFPVVNPSIGYGPVPLITSLPVRHWSMIFRPQYLPFFFLPLDQAFAFYWNFKWCALFLGAFLFLELITGGRGFLALAGAAFILFSGFIQWWFSSPTMMPEMIGMLFFGLWATAIVFRSASLLRAVGAAFVLLGAIAQFAFCSYPRFQIPLLYLALFLLFGAAWKFRPQRDRLILFTGTLLAAALLLAVWLREIGPLLAEIGTLVYPGQVSYTGGTFLWSSLAAPFFEFAMTEEHYPFTLGNSCEAAGFIFLLPLLLALLLRDAVSRRFDPLLIAPTIFALVLACYMCLGVPASLARWSGLWLVADTRANIALGLASGIALFRYLARPDPETPLLSLPRQCALFAVIAVLFFGIFYRANLALARYVTSNTVTVTSIYFALVAMVIWNRRAHAACTLLLAPLVCAYGLINPITRGLPAFEQSPVWRTMRELLPGDADGRWLVLGYPGESSIMAQFAKSTGAHVLGGARCNPDPETIRLLDPSGAFRQVHGRYAHISFVPSENPTPAFELASIDSYFIHLPVQSGLLQRLGVTGVLELNSDGPKRDIAGFEEMRSVLGMRFLRATQSKQVEP